MPTVTLYRPVGQKEYDLIAASGFKKFPPRLSFQPIFYPVLTESYAIQIAKEWNTKDQASGYTGHVSEFDVSKDFLDKYPIKQVGTAAHKEYWIPAEDLDLFNENIVGSIRVVYSYFGKQPNSIAT